MGVVRLIGQCPNNACRVEDHIIGDGEADREIKVQCRACGTKWRDFRAALQAANRAGLFLVPYLLRLDRYAVQVTQLNPSAIGNLHEVWRWWTEALMLKFRLRRDPTCEVRLIGPRAPFGGKRAPLQLMRMSECLGLYDGAPATNPDSRQILAWSADFLNLLFLNSKDPRTVARAQTSIAKIIGKTELSFQATRRALFIALRDIEGTLFAEVIYDLVTQSVSVKTLS